MSIMNQSVLRKIRIVGIDDGSFKKGLFRRAVLALVLFNGSGIVDVKFVKILVDGLDATSKVVNSLKSWTFDAVMLAGVSFAGFNLIDPFVIFQRFIKPVIIISGTKPNNRKVKLALQKHFSDWKVRWEVFKKLGTIHQVRTFEAGSPLYVEVVGGDLDWAKTIIRNLAFCSRIPEPLRVAHIIARGVH